MSECLALRARPTAAAATTHYINDILLLSHQIKLSIPRALGAFPQCRISSLHAMEIPIDFLYNGTCVPCTTVSDLQVYTAYAFRVVRDRYGEIRLCFSIPPLLR